MIARQFLLLLAISVLSTLILTAGGLTNREPIRHMDFVADRFGFPYWWVEHVSVTFAGVTDYWHFEITNLVKNIILFFLLTFGCGLAVLLLKQARNEFRNEGKKFPKLQIYELP